MKNIATILFAACAIAASAQTQEAPQPIVMGENSCATSALSTVYFSYTAPEDQLVTLDGVGSITVTADNKTVPAASNSSTNVCRFAVEGNREYLISVYAFSDIVEFTASATACAYSAGTSCDDPVVAMDEPFFVPFYSEGGMWGTKTPIYISYTADADGRLEMKFDGALGTLAYSGSCSGEFTTVGNGNYVDGGWMASFDVEDGQTYIIKGTASTAMMASFEVMLPDPGASCADPWTARRGENGIPAEAGSYWYSITTPAAPANCFIVLQSEAALPGGKITVKSSCTSSYGDIEQEEVMALRIPSGANAYRLLNIVKAEATADVERFTLAFQDLQTYDSFATAEPIEAGQTVTTPDFGGTYYYAVTAPAKGQMFLDLKADAAVVSGTSVELYDQEKDFLALANGTDRIHYEVTPGTTYVIKWVCPDTMRSLPFSVAFNPVQPGETEANALDAILGANSVPESAAVYFSYTAATDSWLVVRPSDKSMMPDVHSVASDGWKTAVNTYVIDNGEALKFEATAGDRYLLTFRDTGADASFNLSELPYAEGETAANPIVVTGSEIGLQETAGKTWYSYSIGESGILEITTTMKYAYGNSVAVYLNEVSDANRQTMSTESYDSDNYAMLSMSVHAGDVVYVCATTMAPQPEAVIGFNVRQPEPGETADNPIAIDFNTNPMEYRFDRTVSYGDSPVWYSINLSGEIFNMDSDGSFGMSMYAAGDTGTPVATSTGSMFGPNYIRNVVVSVPGTYLLKLTSASAAFDVTFSEREAGEGEVPAKAYKIQPAEVPYAMEFPAVAYGEMPVWYVMELNEGDFNLVQSETATAALYKDGEYTDPVARLAYSFSTDLYAIDRYQVTEAGNYYYRIESSYSACNATLSGSAIKLYSSVDRVVDNGAFSVVAVAGGIAVTAADTDVRIYTTDGRIASTMRVNGDAFISLPRGLYIVCSADSTAKIAVR